MTDRSDRWVYLVPTGTADLPGVPLVPYRCTREEAALLLRPTPPAFRVADEAPEGAVRPDRSILRRLEEATP
jgi:hypothetical protein